MSQISDLQSHQRGTSPSQHSSTPYAASTKLTEQQLLLLQQQWAQTSPRHRSDQTSLCWNRSLISGLQFSRVRGPAQGNSLTPYTSTHSVAGNVADTAPDTPHNMPAHRGLSFPGFVSPADNSTQDPSDRTTPGSMQQQQQQQQQQPWLAVRSKTYVCTGEPDPEATSPVGTLRSRHIRAGHLLSAAGDSPFVSSSSNSNVCTPDTPAWSSASIKTSRTYSMPGRVSTPSSKYPSSNSSSSANIGGNFPAILSQDSVHSISTPASRTYSKMYSNIPGLGQQGSQGIGGQGNSILQPAFSTNSQSSFASNTTTSTTSASTPRRRGNAVGNSTAAAVGSYALRGSSFSSSTGSWTPQSSASSRVRTPFTPSAGSGPRSHHLSQSSPRRPLQAPAAAGYSAASTRAAAAARISGSGLHAGYSATRVSASGSQAGYSTGRVSASGLQAGHSTVRVSASGLQADYTTARVSNSGSLASYTTACVSTSGSQAPSSLILAAAKAEHAALMAQLAARRQGGRVPYSGSNASSGGGNFPAQPYSLSDLTPEALDSLGSLQSQGSLGAVSGFRAVVQGSSLGRRLSHAGSVAGSVLGEVSFMTPVPETTQAAAATGLPAAAPEAPYDPATTWDTDSDSGSEDTSPNSALAARFTQQSLGYTSSSTFRPAGLHSISTSQVPLEGHTGKGPPQAAHQVGHSKSILARLFCLQPSGTLSPSRAHSPRITQPTMTKKVRYGRKMNGRFGKGMGRLDGVAMPADTAAGTPTAANHTPGGERYPLRVLSAAGSSYPMTTHQHSMLSSTDGLFGTAERIGACPQTGSGAKRTTSWGGFSQPTSAATAYHGGYSAAYSSRRGSSTAGSIAAERAGRIVAAQLQAFEAGRAASSGGSWHGGSAPFPAASAAAAPCRLSDLSQQQLQLLQLPLAAGTAASLRGTAASLRGSAAGSVVSEAVSAATYRSGGVGPVAGSRRGMHEGGRQLQAVYEKGQLC